MFKRLRERLTYANVMATAAVFLALGLGSAWAATELGRNSVGARQIKPNAIRSSDVKNEALRGIDVAPHSLTRADIKHGAITGLTSIWCGPHPDHECVGDTDVNSESPKRVFTTCEGIGKANFTWDAYVVSPSNVPVLTKVSVQHVITGDWIQADAYEVNPTSEDWGVGLRLWCID
jgi:hypothetical protein